MADLSGTPDGFFRSFWIAGFESACHINRAGLRLDMLATTEHDKQAATDYELLHCVGHLHRPRWDSLASDRQAW
jgi:hypothetical protein